MPSAKLRWEELYRDSNDAFTLPEVNPNLKQYWEILAGGWKLSSSEIRRCLVPLCGRDISLTWLASQPGWGAVGVDFAGNAFSLLGSETGGIVPITNDERAPFHAFQSSRYPRLLLAHGDFLALDVEHYGGPFEAAWDRGGFTSMGSGQDRALYTKKVSELLLPGGKVLVEMLDTNIFMDGACGKEEAMATFASAGLEVEALVVKDVMHQYPEFRPPGLGFLREVVFVAKKAA